MEEYKNEGPGAARVRARTKHDSVTAMPHVAKTAAGAEAFVSRQMNGIDATSRPTVGGFLPVARLRSDQVYLKARLEERGVTCEVVDPEGAKRVISDAMLEAGGSVFRRLYPIYDGEELRSAEVVREIYEAMEAAR